MHRIGAHFDYYHSTISYDANLYWLQSTMHSSTTKCARFLEDENTGKGVKKVKK